MCFDPISFAVTAATAAAPYAGYAAAGLGALGALQQGAAAETAGRQAQAEGEFNARQLEQRARDRRFASGVEQDRAQRVARLRQGQARANAAGSGVALEGSPLEALAFNAEQQAEELALLGWQANMDERDLLTQAGMERTRGANARRAGQSARQGSFLRAGSALLMAPGRWGGGGASPERLTGRLAGPV
ncbi:MAG: hypothetical protein K2X74_00495 [Acetobacteraceae bacterium]|nr:hypothetical protein [Acetobacteraceae bacterium]